MYGFVDDTKLEDCSLIKKEGNKIPSLGSEKMKAWGWQIALTIQQNKK